MDIFLSDDLENKGIRLLKKGKERDIMLSYRTDLAVERSQFREFDS